MTKDEVLKLAMEALENIKNDPFKFDLKNGIDKAITAIKEALAQPEPVAWEQFYPEMGSPKLAYLSPTESFDNACYTPPQRTWVGLTDEEREEIHGSTKSPYDDLIAVEAKLKEKNT